jgi:ABC-2 type transport system permease protein
VSSNLSALLWKEFRQLPRKRGAMLSATLFPLLFFVVVPAINMAAMRTSPGSVNTPVGVNLPPGIGAVARNPEAMLTSFLLPLFVMIAGLMLPSLLATYTIIAERERRTLELLVALPVSVKDIILAKLGAVLGIGAGICLPLLAIDSVLLITLGFGGLGDALLLLWLLLAALAYSTASALLLSLLAKDFRTANNVTGALVGPLILVAMGIIVFLPPVVAPLLLGAVLWLLTAAAVAVSLRWLTFEKLLS